MRYIYTSLLILFAFSLSISSALAEPLMSSVAKQAIVVDYDTGAILLEINADEQMPTSSMSKVMTMYLVFDALKQGQIALDDEFMVSEKAWRKGGSKMFVEVGKTVKVEDLIRGVIIQSGNDATIVLAEGLTGTEDGFAAAITEKAHEIGMANSNFKNASGWPDPEHYSTARDLSILAQSLIKNFPEYYHYYAEMEFTYNGIKQDNRNPLLYKNIGADGIKTGHTDVGGYGLIGSGVHDGRRVVVVVNGLKSTRERAEESSKLLDWGLKRFENKVLFSPGDDVVSLDVAFGKDKIVLATVSDDLVITLPKLLKQKFEVKVQAKQPLIAPIKQGDEVGYVLVDVPHYGEIKKPIYAAQNVERQGFVQLTFSKMAMFLSDLGKGG